MATATHFATDDDGNVYRVEFVRLVHLRGETMAYCLHTETPLTAYEYDGLWPLDALTPLRLADL